MRGYDVIKYIKNIIAGDIIKALHIVYKMNLYFPVISRMMQTIVGVDGIQLLVKE